ncbi:MAG: hypothetical protein L0Y80_12060 [Ignavibacteriae bacterium]|nr:hypothetical protein [Ignavibacteriota bacterium]
MSTKTGGWYETPVNGYATSRWLDFVSVLTDNSTVPDSVRYTIINDTLMLVTPDSIMVVNHSDRDTVYLSDTFDEVSFTHFYRRFYFYDGYTDRFGITQQLDLSVYLYYP